MYKVSFNCGETIKTAYISGRCLQDALQNHCNACIENNKNDVYTKLENVNISTAMNNKHFHIVHTKYGDFGINIVDIEIINENRSKASLLLKAKREQLGLSIWQFCQLSGMFTYKSHEANNRQMSLCDFLWYWKVLSCYENGENIPPKPKYFTGDLIAAGNYISQLVTRDILNNIGVLI